MKITTRQLTPFYLPLILIVGIGCGGSSPTIATPPPPLIGKAYVAAPAAFSVLRFPAGASGNVAPENSVVGLKPEEPVSVAVDLSHDRLVMVAGGIIPQIIFVDNASTTMQPVRAVSGPATALSLPGRVLIDPTRDLVYIGDGSSTVLVFGPASTISGDVAALHIVSGPFSIAGIALDAANDRLFISEQAGNINVFDNASTLNGTVVPNRVITGGLTGITIPGALGLDSSGCLIVANRSAIIPPSSDNILIFANAGSISGNVAPAASATLSANGTPEAMAISPAGELYVVDGSASVTVYSNIGTAPGNLTPARVISGSNTGLNPPLGSPGGAAGIALDLTR